MTTAAPAIRFVRDPQRAAALLQPLRIRMLQLLREPDSASGLARQLDLPRQRVNYHLRALEKDGLVEMVEERKKGNCVERVVRAVARSYVISPEALGELAADPNLVRDRFSSAYLVATAAAAIRDLGELRARAEASGKRLATLTLESEIRFATPGDRQAFTEELSNAVARLVAKYHDDESAGGRRFKLMLGAYPAIGATKQPPNPEDQEENDD